MGIQSLCCQLKTRNKSLYPSNSTDLIKVVGPISTDNLTHQADGYFMGYLNTKLFLFYSYPRIY